MADQYGYIRGEYSTSNRTYFPDSSSYGYGYGTKPFAQQDDYKYSSSFPGNTWGTRSGQDWPQQRYSTGLYGGSGYSTAEYSTASSAATHGYGMNDSWNRPLCQTTRNDCSWNMQGMNNGWGTTRPITSNRGVGRSGTSEYYLPYSLSTPTNSTGAALETEGSCSHACSIFSNGGGLPTACSIGA